MHSPDAVCALISFAGRLQVPTQFPVKCVPLLSTFPCILTQSVGKEGPTPRPIWSFRIRKVCCAVSFSWKSPFSISFLVLFPFYFCLSSGVTVQCVHILSSFLPCLPSFQSSLFFLLHYSFHFFPRHNFISKVSFFFSVSLNAYFVPMHM